VDERLGTLDDFDALVAEAHRLGLKVVVASRDPSILRQLRLRYGSRPGEVGTIGARQGAKRATTPPPS
ncbi:hypothetical protein AB0N19_24945, partial [Streptomyces sp. NPDC051132]|uniref:hypothetical protein n=1 Tax=Streptomyces sp. NPDC051132 TaxID=3155667 RepID=UPI00342F1137